MWWGHASWKPAPSSFAAAVLEALDEGTTDEADDVEAKISVITRHLIDVSRGASRVYEDLISVLEETGWSWDGQAGDVPPGLRSFVRHNDKLSDLMVLRRLIGVYDLGDYEREIMLNSISRAFPTPSPQVQTQDVGQALRDYAEQQVKQHGRREAGLDDGSGRAEAVGRTRSRGGTSRGLPPLGQSGTGDSRPASAGSVRRQTGLLPPRDAGGGWR